MSLDIYLNIPSTPVRSESTGIFIREGGQNREISWAEWDEKFPGREPVIAERESEDPVFNRNITHNLNRMAGEAGVYEALWRPEELNITKARQLIEPLRAGLEKLKADPAHFEQFNPANGWGDYDGLVNAIQAYLTACEKYPDADVSVSR